MPPVGGRHWHERGKEETFPIYRLNQSEFLGRWTFHANSFNTLSAQQMLPRHLVMNANALSDWWESTSKFEAVLPGGRDVGIGDAAQPMSEIEVSTTFELLDEWSEPDTAAEPPALAEFLVGALLPNAKSDAAIGDLNERFERDCQEYGAARARRLYWSRTLRSLWPLLGAQSGALPNGRHLSQRSSIFRVADV